MKKISTLLITLCLYANSYAQSNLTLTAKLSYPGMSFSGMWHYVDSNGSEYALAGISDGLRIFDITSPTNPLQVAAVAGQTSIWREVKTYSHYAYVCTESGAGTAGFDNGLQIIDLSGLPGALTSKFYSDSILGSLLMRGHTVTVSDNGYLYVNGTHLANGIASGVLIFNLSDPWNPVYVGNYTASYVHDCIVYNDTMISSELGNGFAIVDVSNKANPVVLQTQPTQANFNHNTWRSDNGNILFTADEVADAPLAAYDITDINNIELLDSYLTENTPSGEVHNVRVLNDFLICPSYGSKVTIVDAARPDNLIETGWYPTFSNLCWDADPYLPSGNLFACDMAGNFYVFTPNYVRACYLEGIVTDSVSGWPIPNAFVEVMSTLNNDSSNLDGIYKTGAAVAGTYTVNVIADNYFGKAINNVVLNNGLLTTLNVQLLPLNVSVNEVNTNLTIDVFPNPLTEVSIIKLPEILAAINNLSITFFDRLGNKLMVEKVNSRQIELLKKNFISGVYFFEISDSKNVMARGKFLVQ